MQLRRRVGMVAAVAVGIAVLLVAIVSYFVVRHQLLGQVDNALRAQAGTIQHNVYTLAQPMPAISRK